ncbi:PREDICTED: non-structural maintenance of chromosomes element 3 homolog [Branchiostoma belcheri]|uniref:Non-structural maintenance of chromosomes element 3 homolog n=1 Tax=Branchiostoma belcheri TaxID=7741 RepID=A0A6P4YPU6_BRABE|nr:PREDICTED: non-structural maintenance of chromosomes element 3 homolog [Branchiostoma belcheri]
MPKARGKTARSRQQDEDSDMETDPPTQASQTTLTQAQRAAESLSRQEIERKVNEVVQFFLIMEQKKAAVKRADITKHILKEHSKVFPVVLEKAKKKLREVFGVSVEELEGKDKRYILVNLVDTPDGQDHLNMLDEGPKSGLLLVVLSLIFMKGNVIQDTLLWHTLKRLGIQENQPHEVLGDVKSLLTKEFTRQLYLEYKRVPQSDPPSFEFRWGPRAHKETTKRRVLQFVSKMYGSESLEIWTSQYQDVLRSEGGEGGGQ